MLFITSAFFALALALASVVLAQLPPTSTTVTVRIDDNFCLLLPPMPGGNIAETADDAVAYCTDHIRAIPNTGNTPKGFIKSRHIVKNNKKKWVQVTGRIDRDKYSLSRFDRGGQIDAMIRADANCVGYKYFVQLMEPDVEHYCLRCCQRKSDCPINKPNKGCRAVIPGDYT